MNEVDEEIMVTSNVLIELGYRPEDGQVKELGVSFKALVYYTWQSIAMPIRLKNDKVYLIQVYDNGEPDTAYRLVPVEEFINATTFSYSSLYKKIKSLNKQVAILKTVLVIAVIYVLTQIQSDHYLYNTSIGDELKNFFEQYNKDFEAHEAGNNIDYQLMNPDKGLVCIEYVISYLHLMSLENIFCAKFEPSVIHKALLGYKQTYKDLPVNIFEQVLLNALGCVIANQDIISLNFSAADRQRLKRTFNSDSEIPFCDLLEQAAVKLIGFLNITSKPLQAYIHSCIPGLVMSF